MCPSPSNIQWDLLDEGLCLFISLGSFLSLTKSELRFSLRSARWSPLPFLEVSSKCGVRVGWGQLHVVNSLRWSQVWSSRCCLLSSLNPLRHLWAHLNFGFLSRWIPNMSSLSQLQGPFNSSGYLVICALLWPAVGHPGARGLYEIVLGP